MTTLDIGPMSRADLAIALGWAKTEGWNPGRDDADCFWGTDPTGFLMGRIDGNPVACISAIPYGPAFGFVGMYICTPSERGKGFGMQLWRTALNMLGDRTIGLDGVVAQQANYAREGFVLAHRNTRFAGTAPRLRPRSDSHLETVTRDNFDGMAALDAACFPGERPGFLRCWIRAPRAALLFVEGGAVRGYGVMRQAAQGYRIGPLFAETAEIAEALFVGFMAEVPAEKLFIDVPAANRQAVAMMQRHGFEPAFETARMYRGRAPDLPLNRIFGLTTLELG